MEQSFRLYLVRHGQTDLNRDSRFRGFTDAPLNARGRLEAAGAAAVLHGSGIEVIYSSPMPRALQTAEIISEAVGAPVEIDEGFTDIDYGEWQGLTVEEVAQRFGREALETWMRDPAGFTFPGGDSMRSVGDRLGPALERVSSAGAGAAAAVSHLAVLKVCLIVAMGLDFEYFWRLGLDNGSVSLFSRAPGSGFVLESWNRAPEVAPD
jgi:broad specificity phosphatase PhoE